MLLAVKNVRKSFKGTEVLKDVNLSVRKGDVVVIFTGRAFPLKMPAKKKYMK